MYNVSFNIWIKLPYLKLDDDITLTLSGYLCEDRMYNKQQKFLWIFESNLKTNTMSYLRFQKW